MTVSLSLDGPRAIDIFDHPPQQIIVGLIISSLFMIITTSIYIVHMRRLYTVSKFTIRVLYEQICYFSMIFAITGFLSLWFIRVALIFEFIRAISEAFTLQKFQYLLVHLIGHSINNVGDKLQKEEPYAVFSQPPFACCFKTCETPKTVNRDILKWCLYGTQQYVYVIFFAAFFQLWLRLDGNTNERAYSACSFISSASMFIAIYSLFIIYKATHRILEKYEPTFKFISIKLVLIIASLQETVIHAIVKDDASIGANYNAEAVRLFIINLFVVIESSFLAILLYFAFPSEELVEFYKLHVKNLSILKIGAEMMKLNPSITDVTWDTAYIQHTHLDSPKSKDYKSMLFEDQGEFHESSLHSLNNILIPEDI